MRVLLSVLLLAVALPAQHESLDIDKLVYVARIGETEIGRESVEIRKDGWSTKGKFDIFGTRKGNFRATLVRKKDGFDYEIASDASGQMITAIGAFKDGKYSIARKGSTKKKTIDAAGDRFVFDNLVWATMIDVCGVLAGSEARGELAAGQKLLGIVGGQAAAFAIEHVDTKRSEQVVKGRRIALRISLLKFPPSNQVWTVVSTARGVPLRIDIPAQKLTLNALGYENVRGANREPTSIVDSGPWRVKLSKPTRGYKHEKNVRMPMRDGVELATDIYLPEGDGPFPTVLARTPYTRSSEGALKGPYYAKRGYAFVAQDVRGRFDSGGAWQPLLNETRDGSDTLDWIAKQKWSDGKVGMVGASYVGLVQWLAAKSGNSHLVCIVPQVSPPDPHENFPYEGGAFLLGAAWWAKFLDAQKQGNDWRKGIDWKKMYATLPLGDLDSALGLSEGTFLDEWLSHPPHDTEYWGDATYQGELGKIDLPAMHISGWFDGDQPGAVQNFVKMRRAAEKSRDHQYLVMGPWTHFFNTQRRIGKVDFGDEAIIDLDSRILRFFDRYLKGVENGIENEPRVHSFTMGTNRWHGAKDWPIPGTVETKLYLSNNGNAKQRDGDGKLSLAVTSDDKPSDSYRYDPMDLPELDIDFTDTSGARATAADDSADREDNLEYTSPPLAADCEITGQVRAVLWVSTDAKDTDFTAALFRIAKDGKRFSIRGGVQRLRYAKDPVRDNPVPPGEVARVTIDCWATALRLKKGERIQLVIASTAWPGYGRNLNTLESPLTAKKAVIATNTIHHTADRPSHVIIPVVSRDGAPGLRLAK